MMKKLMTAVLVLVITLSTLPLSAAAETVSPADDFQWRFTGDTVEVKAYVGAGGDVVIPASYQGSPVTSIGISAFEKCDNITSVTIPDSVTLIDKFAFRRCSLANVFIPHSVTEIGRQAFFYCSALKRVDIPSGIITLEPDTFAGCKNLVDVNIPSGVTRIGGGAFYGCSSLTNLYIPGSVNSIGDEAFYGCTSLTDVIIDNGVSVLGGYVFYGCSSLLHAAVPPSVTDIGSGSFHACPQVTIHVSKDSYAQAFAQEGDISFQFSNPQVPARLSSDQFVIDGKTIFPLPGMTTADLKSGFAGGDYIKIMYEAAELSDTQKVGTGTTVQLMDGAWVKDSVTVMITGEIDGDGVISAADALLVLQSATDKVMLNATQEQAAKVSGSAGTVSASDALLILQYATQKIQSFPSAA